MPSAIENGPVPIPDGEKAGDLLAEIRKAIDPDKIWHTVSMAKLTVRFENGSFKKTAIAAGDPPLILTGVREGKRADFIFEFEPVDTRPYQGVEMDETQVFKMLDGFEDHVVRALGFGRSAAELEATDPESVLDGDEERLPGFKQACAKWRLDIKKRAAKAAEEARQAEADKASQSYAANPLWGAFA